KQTTPRRDPRLAVARSAPHRDHPHGAVEFSASCRRQSAQSRQRHDSRSCCGLQSGWISGRAACRARNLGSPCPECRDAYASHDRGAPRMTERKGGGGPTRRSAKDNPLERLRVLLPSKDAPYDQDKLSKAEMDALVEALGDGFGEVLR